MDQNEKVTNDKITRLENEIKVLKNEVQSVLLDLRESYLNMETPFNSAANPSTTQQIILAERAPARDAVLETHPKDNSRQEDTEPQRTPAEESQKTEAPKSEEGSPSERAPVNNAPDMVSAYAEREVIPTLLQAKKETQTPESPEPGRRKNSQLDLVTMAGLTGWVELSSQKLGRERTEAVLEISEAMGYVSGDLKTVLVKLISLAPEGTGESPTRSRDYIDSLIKLNSLLGKDNREDIALLLLSLVSGDTHHG